MYREYLKEASRCTIQVAGYVAFNDPLVRAAVSGEPFSNVRHGVIGAAVGPESIRVSTEIGFPDWFQDHPECLLNNAVIEHWYAKRPLLVAIGLGDIHPSHRYRLKCFCFE